MKMSWWSYVLMLLVYLLYLFVGAGTHFYLFFSKKIHTDFFKEFSILKRVKVVFSHLESDAERTRCDTAMQQVKIQKADFANKYFYIFGLNLKFCKGIREYKARLSPAELEDQQRMNP